MQSLDPIENNIVPILKRLFGTQSHYVYFVEFDVKCNVCYTLRVQIYLQKCMLQYVMILKVTK